MEKAIEVASVEQLNGENNEYTSDLVDEQEQPAFVHLPLLPVRNTVLLPNVVASLVVTQAQAQRAIEEAINTDHLLFAVTQLHEQLENPGTDDFYTIGVESHIERMLRMPDGTMSILLRGRRRLRRIAFTQELPYIRVQAEVILDKVESTLALEALRRAVLAQYEQCVNLNPLLSDEVYITAMNIRDAGLIADFVVSTLDLPVPARQNVLESCFVFKTF